MRQCREAADTRCFSAVTQLTRALHQRNAVEQCVAVSAMLVFASAVCQQQVKAFKLCLPRRSVKLRRVIERFDVDVSTIVAYASCASCVLCGKVQRCTGVLKITL